MPRTRRTAALFTPLLHTKARGLGVQQQQIVDRHSHHAQRVEMPEMGGIAGALDQPTEIAG